MKWFATLLLVSFCLPTAGMADMDVFKVQARGFQLGMSYTEANSHANKQLDHCLVEETKEYLLYKPDTQGLAGYDLSLWFSNTPEPKLYDLTLHRRFSSILNTEVLVDAYESTFGSADDACQHSSDFGDEEYVIWGGSIEHCDNPHSPATKSSNYILVSIKNAENSNFTDVVLRLHSKDIFDKALVRTLDVKKDSEHLNAASLLDAREAHAAAVSGPPVSVAIQKDSSDDDLRNIEPEPTTTDFKKTPSDEATSPLAQTAAPKPQQPHSKPDTGHVVQLASYTDKAAAKAKALKLSNEGLDCSIVLLYSGNQAWHVVQAGPFSSSSTAQEAASRIKRVYSIDGLVKHLDPTLLAERTYYSPIKQMAEALEADPQDLAAPTEAKAAPQRKDQTLPSTVPAQPAASSSPAKPTTDKPSQPVAAQKSVQAASATSTPKPASHKPSQALADDSPKRSSEVHSREPKSYQANQTRHSIHIGAFLEQDRAQKLADLYGNKGYTTAIMRLIDDKQRTWHTVHIGAYTSREQALGAGKRFKSRENKDFYISTISEKLLVERMYYENYGTSLLDDHSNKHLIQIASCRSMDAAKAMVKTYVDRGYAPSVFKMYDKNNKEWLVVGIGEYTDPQTAQQAATSFQERWGFKVLVTTLSEELLRKRFIET